MENPLFSDSITFYILNIGFFNLKENANLAEFTRKMYFNDAAQVAIFNRFLQIRGFSVFKTMKVVFFLSRSAIPFRTQFKAQWVPPFLLLLNTNYKRKVG